MGKAHFPAMLHRLAKIDMTRQEWIETGLMTDRLDLNVNVLRQIQEHRIFLDKKIRKKFR